MLSVGRGSLDYAQKLLSDGDSNPAPPMHIHTRPSWCRCNICKPMATPEENKCCGKKTCITSYALFSQLCTDRNTLFLAVRSRCDIRTDSMDMSMNGFRKQAYRQYILWTFGNLGEGDRRIIPSCVVNSIRAIYPSPDGVYMGFRRS